MVIAPVVEVTDAPEKSEIPIAPAVLFVLPMIVMSPEDVVIFTTSAAAELPNLTPVGFVEDPMA